MSQFLAKVEAIRKALGLRPAEELPAPLAISDAMALMGIKANESWALPERFEALKEALDLTGFGKSRAASSAKACSNHARVYIGAISKGLGQAEDLRCGRATVCISCSTMRWPARQSCSSTGGSSTRQLLRRRPARPSLTLSSRASIRSPRRQVPERDHT
jgi:hypothetical protein